MRVLHLFDEPHAKGDPGSIGGAALRLAMLADGWGRLGAVEQELLLVGGGKLARQASSLGLEPFARVGAGGLSILAVRAALARHRRDAGASTTHGHKYDVVHAWSPAMLTAATMLLPTTPRLLTATCVPSTATAKWVRVLGRDGPGRTIVLAASASVRREYLMAGLDVSAVHLVRPGVDMSRIDLGGRTELRRNWGLTAEEPATVLATLADRPADVPARMMLRLAVQTIHHHRWPRGRQLLVLLHQDQPGAADAVNQCAQWNSNLHAMIETKVAEPWHVLSGVDAAAALEPAPTLCLGWAMAAGSAILAPATYPVCELLEDRHSALLAKPGDGPGLASKLVELMLDPATAWKLRDTGRHEAYSYFPRTRYCQTLEGIYGQIARGLPIDAPAPTVTGGLRFHGGHDRPARPAP